MEYAFWLEGRNKPGRIPVGTRIYVGEECCPRKISSLDSLMDRACNIKEWGAAMTLVTPPVSESGLEQIEQILDRLRSIFNCFEVVCNDWGVFSSC